MDFRNVLMAIVLSTIVLVVWATLFEAPIVEKQIVENEIKKEEKVSTPSLEEMESSKKISRNEAINKDDRIKLENNNIRGSISLVGGIIDDVKSIHHYSTCVFTNTQCGDIDLIK